MKTITPKAMKRWVWLPGMQGFTQSGRTFRVTDSKREILDIGFCMPNIDDPVTGAALLTVVRLAWRQPHILPRLRGFDFQIPNPEGRTWEIAVLDLDDPDEKTLHFYGHTEHAALIAALEGAP